MTDVTLHAVGCYSLKQRPNASEGMTPSHYEIWSCRMCDAKIWVGARCREVLAADASAAAICFDCVEKLASRPECTEVILNPLS